MCIRDRITVHNQGTLDATDVDVTDYIPADMNFDPTAALNVANSWSPGGTTTASTTISSIAAGSFASVQILLEVDLAFTGTSIVNNAEITAADNSLSLPDEDSTPNDNSGTPPELGTDDEISDDSNGSVDNPIDEDDYDPAEIEVGQIFDLAL